MKRFIAGMVVGIVMTGSAVYAQGTPVLSGQRFLASLDENLRALYSIGYHDGFVSAATFGRVNSTTMLRTGACIDRWSYGQTSAVIEKFVRENPERWHEPVGLLAFLAVVRACAVP